VNRLIFYQIFLKCHHTAESSEKLAAPQVVKNYGPSIELKGLLLGLQEPLAIIVNQLDTLYMPTHYFCKVLFYIIVSTALQSRFFSSLFLIRLVYLFSFRSRYISCTHNFLRKGEIEIIVIPNLQEAFYIR